MLPQSDKLLPLFSCIWLLKRYGCVTLYLFVCLQGTHSVSFDTDYYKGETMIGWCALSVLMGTTPFTYIGWNF